MTDVGINGLGPIDRFLARPLYERYDARHARELIMSNEVADVPTVVQPLKYDYTRVVLAPLRFRERWTANC